MKCCDCGLRLTSLFARSVSVPRSVSAPSKNSSKVPKRLALPSPYPPSLMMTNWRPCFIRRPIPSFRPVTSSRIGPPSIRSSSARGLKTTALGGVHPTLSQKLLQLLPVQRMLQVLMSSAKAIHTSDPEGGGKALIDYCGPTVPIVSPTRGEIRHPQTFVAGSGLPTRDILK